jgi:hypothetical protein
MLVWFHSSFSWVPLSNFLGWVGARVGWGGWVGDPRIHAPAPPKGGPRGVPGGSSGGSPGVQRHPPPLPSPPAPFFCDSVLRRSRRR